MEYFPSTYLFLYKKEIVKIKKNINEPKIKEGMIWSSKWEFSLFNKIIKFTEKLTTINIYIYLIKFIFTNNSTENSLY